MFEVKQNASEIWEDQEETTGDDDDSSGEELPSSDGSESVTGLDEAAIEEKSWNRRWFRVGFFCLKSTFI